MYLPDAMPVFEIHECYLAAINLLVWTDRDVFSLESEPLPFLGVSESHLP